MVCHAAMSLERINLGTRLLLVNARLKLPQFIDTDNGTGGDRTHGLSLRRRSLYPTELQPQGSSEFGVRSFKNYGEINISRSTLIESV